MQKTILLSILLLSQKAIFAQSTCVANLTCLSATADFGVCPDSIAAIPLLSTEVNTAFSAQLSIKIPATVVSGGLTATLDQYVVTDIEAFIAGVYVPISNLGLSYIGSGSNTPSVGSSLSGFTSTNFCYFPAPSLLGQCIEITGNTNQVGTFLVRIKSQASGTIFPFPTSIWQAAPDVVDEYYITVSAFTGKAKVVNGKSFSFLLANTLENNLKVSYSNNSVEKVAIKLFNLLGKEVYSNNTESKLGLNELLINTKNIQAGIYVCAITNGNSTYTKRILVD